MNVILNPGTTPIMAGFLRGIIAGLLIGAGEALRGYVVEGYTVDQSVARGFMIAIPVWIGLTGYGVADQSRANAGVVAPADVPAQVVAADKKITPEVAASNLSGPNPTT